ncbi:MAG: TIR domain-containing protein, partial [bacterium]
MNPDNAPRDIFLSYSSKDREFAGDLARAMQNAGFTVWWDLEIPTGAYYPKLIETALKSARCVVVLWSQHSTNSRWVRNEADWGAEKEILVPVTIDEIDPPWEFRNFQTLDLSRWNGDGTDPVFAKLIHGLEFQLGRPRRDDSETGTDPEPPPPPSRTRPSAKTPARPWGASSKRWLIAAAVLAAIVVGVFGLDRLRGPDHEQGPPAATDLSFTPLTGDGRTRSSALSPDGEYLVYTQTVNDQTSLHLKQIATGNESVLVDRAQQGIRSPIFSPDGVYVYFAMTGPTYSWSNGAEYDLYRISMLGGNPHLITTGIIGRRFACSPDGNRLVFKRTDGDSARILTAKADGSDERPVATKQRDNATHNCLAWSADGSGIVTSVRDSVTGQINLVAYPIAGGAPRTLPGDQWQVVMDIHALADGSGLLVLGKPVTTTDLNINLWSLATGATRFSPLTNDMTNYYQVSADRSAGSMVLTYYDYKRTLRVCGIDDPDQYRDISTDIVPKGRVKWAGNDELLVNQRVGNRVGLVYMTLETGVVRQVTADVDWIADMALSADGKRLAYRSFRGDNHSIWLANADGSAPHLLTADEYDDYAPQFTPDGRCLVYAHRSALDEPYYIWKRSLDDDTTMQLSEVKGGGPAVSPDG